MMRRLTTAQQWVGMVIAGLLGFWIAQVWQRGLVLGVLALLVVLIGYAIFFVRMTRRRGKREDDDL